LEVTIHTDAAGVEPGEDLTGRLVFHNRGSQQLGAIVGRTLLGGVRAEDEDHIAGSYAGAITFAVRRLELSPGSGHEVPLLIRTASCLPDTSYAVQPGRYEIIAAIAYSQQTGPGTPKRVLVARGAWIAVETGEADK
jgi:hypothetical protein